MTLENHTVIPLSRPVMMLGEQRTELRMREPTVGDQLAAEKMPGSAAEKEVRVMANLCEVPPDEFQRLPLRDYARVQDAYRDFIECDPGTSEPE